MENAEGDCVWEADPDGLGVTVSVAVTLWLGDPVSLDVCVCVSEAVDV